MIDVGANVGLLGHWALSNGWDYLGIEPHPSAYLALVNNLPGGRLENCAVGAVEGIERFWIASATADSSLIPPREALHEIDVVVRTLDSIADSFAPGRNITLLKVEAEGAEPEFLAGATETLSRTEFVAVDAGPERHGQITAPQVLNFLFSLGFEIVDAFLGRGTFLLRKRTESQ